MGGRILIAGTHSGCGKTTVTLAVLAALKKRALAVSAFKCGPDYIDPMFHRSAIGVPSHNLDSFFCTGEQLRTSIAKDAGDIAVIEGVMGYYDGVGVDGAFSTFDVANKTDTPVILVVDAKGMYASVGAVIQGYRSFRVDSRICGVIFNNASPMLYPGLAEIAASAGVSPLGYLPHAENASIGSRYLGLITADEITDIQQKLDCLVTFCEECIDLDGVLQLAATASQLSACAVETTPIGQVPIAVARDAAFCFLYQENLELLTQLGAELVFFSPLADTTLPEKIGGLYLPGGYPELYGKQLSENRAMRQAVAATVTGGLPTIAECGGFLYLHDTLDGYPMAGVIHGAAYKTNKLKRFGYVTLTAKRHNLLCQAGETIPAHSFHYYDSGDVGKDFSAEKPLSTQNWDCIHATDTLYAGFPHLYFPANRNFAESYVRKAIQYAEKLT